MLEVTAARYKIRHAKCVCIQAVDWFPGYPALPPSLLSCLQNRKVIKYAEISTTNN